MFVATFCNIATVRETVAAVVIKLSELVDKGRGIIRQVAAPCSVVHSDVCS